MRPLLRVNLICAIALSPDGPAEAGTGSTPGRHWTRSQAQLGAAGPQSGPHNGIALGPAEPSAMASHCMASHGWGTRKTPDYAVISLYCL